MVKMNKICGHRLSCLECQLFFLDDSLFAKRSYECRIFLSPPKYCSKAVRLRKALPGSCKSGAAPGGPSPELGWPVGSRRRQGSDIGLMSDQETGLEVDPLRTSSALGTLAGIYQKAKEYKGKMICCSIRTLAYSEVPSVQNRGGDVH